MPVLNADLIMMPVYEPAFFKNLSADKKRRLKAYSDILINTAMPAKYVGLCEPAEAFNRYILNSLLPVDNSAADALIENSHRVTDLGSGAGLPGIPLAIVYDETEFILVDSARKRSDFQKYCREQLSLDNLSIVNSEATQNTGAEKTDLVIFRAFRKPLAALEISLYYIKEQGKVLYWRSKQPDFTGSDASVRLSALGFTVKEMLRSDSGEIRDSLLYLEKVSPAESGFPRSFARIHKDSISQKVD